MSILDEVEDYLQEQGAFVNSINGRRSHMDSYMTVMEYAVMAKALKTGPFTKQQWLEAANGMSGYAYLSPMAGLAALTIQSEFCPAFRDIFILSRNLKGAEACTQ
jgi:hypothetical protein